MSRKEVKTIQQRLDDIDYTFTGYTPSIETLMFVEFMKKVNEGGKGEENTTPLIHLKMLDLLFDKQTQNKAIMCFRGASKTTLMEYMILYGMCFNRVFGLHDVCAGMYVANSLKDGAKQFRHSIEQRIRESSFLQEMIPLNKIKISTSDERGTQSIFKNNDELDSGLDAGIKFTDVSLDIVNKNGKPFFVKLFGITTGIRGFKAYGQRPSYCHKKGTMIQTEQGYHLVEDYHTKGQSRIEQGIKVSLFGLIREEIVTKEHRYMTISEIRKTKKEYLKNKKTKASTLYTRTNPEWKEAKDLSFKKKLGNQQTSYDYIIKYIDYTIEKPKPFLKKMSIIEKRNKKGQIVKTKRTTKEVFHKHINKQSFWYLYGLYLTDGSSGKEKLTYYFDSNKQSLIALFLKHCRKLDYKPFIRKIKNKNLITISINDALFAQFCSYNHICNSIKNIPEWILKIDTKFQRQLLLGYINGNGYIDKKNDQIRINSVNEDTINKLGIICERLNLPYHIRYTRKKTLLQIIDNHNSVSVSNIQYELRLSQNVKKVLGYNIKNIPSKQVFIENGILYRGVKSIEFMNEFNEFIPIQTPSHTYNTQFGLSHNCVLDDVLKDSEARSEATIQTIEESIYRAIPYALHPTKRMMIWCGTPFNSKDPLYKAIESPAWKSVLFPIAEKFPCEKKDFKGAWEDRFPYEAVNQQWELALSNGQEQGFRQEMMLQIIPSEGLLVPLSKIVELSSETFNQVDKSMYNFYITTDFAYTDKEHSDYSVISIWAVNNNKDYILCDGFCGKALIDRLIDMLFQYVSKYKPLQVGFEITGQQIGFVNLIMNEMVKRNIFFNLKEIRPSRDKFSRFNLASPLFHQQKIKILSSMMTSSWGTEFKDEISKATIEGFKSKHDDVLDTISQLLDLEIFAPINNLPSDDRYTSVFDEDSRSSIIF